MKKSRQAFTAFILTLLSCFIFMGAAVPAAALVTGGYDVARTEIEYDGTNYVDCECKDCECETKKGGIANTYFDCDTDCKDCECAVQTDTITLSSRSAYLIDFHTGEELFAKNADQKLTIASMVKIMTLLLSFEAIDAGSITMETEVLVSDIAAGMGGSQVFLDANTIHSVSNLIKAITVCSANDASVAMAEQISGSEEAFVAEMNKRAAELGMENTSFTNCTGLPKDGQYSTARDVAKMMRELLRHEEYFSFTKIWLENYIHPDGRETEMTNTNKLVRFYKACDAGKTGFTSESKYCLAASATSGNMRSISVTLASDTSPSRFEDAKKLFGFAFSNYESKQVVKADEAIENQIQVKRGKVNTIVIVPERDIYSLNKRGGGASFSVEYELPTEVSAKIQKGQPIGKIIVKKNGEVIDSCSAVAKEEIAKASVLDGIKKVLEKW